MEEGQYTSFYDNFQHRCNELTSALLEEVPFDDNENITVSNESDDQGNIISKFYNSNDEMILFTKFTHTNLFIYTKKWNNT